MVSCFVSADWSKSPAKRSVYLADVRERRIEKCIPPGAGWDLEALLDVAEDLSRDGSVLIGVDVVLGVPEGYWRSVLEERRQHVPQLFVEWLGSRGDFAGIFEGSIRELYALVIECLERQEVGLWTARVSRCGFRRRAG